MAGEYTGIVQQDDPLYGYLKYEVQPQTGNDCEDPIYHAFRLNGSNPVYLYEEEHTGTKIICKYFLSETITDPEFALKKLEREYFNLSTMRTFGFDQSPYYIAKPYGKNFDLNGLLAIEYCEGELLSSILERAIAEDNGVLILQKLGALAHFLAEWHNRTATEDKVDFDWSCSYFDRMINQTSYLLEPEDIDFFYEAMEEWRNRPEMWEDNRVIVHGDATPENFMFGDDEHVISFDLERCMYADRIFDIGRLCAEVFHFFLLGTGNKYACEPYLGHFLWEYSTHFPDCQETFDAITKRVPFYMGINLLRISRNEWLTEDYRKLLIYEAHNCFLEGE